VKWVRDVSPRTVLYRQSDLPGPTPKAIGATPLLADMIVVGPKSPPPEHAMISSETTPGTKRATLAKTTTTRRK
jgi:hypothetical protein